MTRYSIYSSPGDHIILGDDLYGGSIRMFTNIYEQTALSSPMLERVILMRGEKSPQAKKKRLYILKHLRIQ